MNLFSRILFPASMMAIATVGAIGFNHEPVETFSVPSVAEVRDTVKYPRNGYRLRRNPSQQMELFSMDSLNQVDKGHDSTELDVFDTIPRLSARDTIKVPDSLRFTDPFRYRFYVALLDSLTHRQTRDSLIKSIQLNREQGDTLRAIQDSLDWRKLDSLYAADSTFAAKQRFIAWYNGLSKAERKAYDLEQKEKRKIAMMDSLRVVKEEKQAIKDSIIENTPRILETFAIPDSLYYKRIISWTVDQDFHKMEFSIPDTTYNYHYFDLPFQREDVNATWLGVAGSPVQYYNVNKRNESSCVDFYKPFEAWSHNPSNLPHYNSKTPYTELAYFGTLFATRSKENDNLHLFTTQNITPALNFSLLYDRFGGEGILMHEKTINNNFVAQVNFVGKKYMMHTGYIRNVVKMEENGGITDPHFVRDTTMEMREIPINLSNASSQTEKHTFFLNQQLRIPFTFIEKMKAKKDSTYKFDPDSLNKDITSAFIGHSTEYTAYKRTYQDKLTSAAERAFYNNVSNIAEESADTLRTNILDNKLFIRLQPWSSEAIVSKLDVGIGDYLKHFRSPEFQNEKLTINNIAQNSVYLYAGAEGQVKNTFLWDAKARTVFLGADAGDFNVKARAMFRFYPFRRARKSPLSLNAIFETSLKQPDWYQQHLLLNHYSWNNDFSKTLTTSIKGEIDIPYWKARAQVGYTMLSNNLYYDANSIIRQNDQAMSILSASLEKNLKLGPLHLDNRALLQISSNQDVVPVPLAAFNLRYYLQFVAQWDESHTNKILEMQFGVNAYFNTKWNSPAWNPNIGVFYNQNVNSYNNGPYFDVFLNMQWKRACIFVKYQNAGMGWPMKKFDYFSADRHTVTESGTSGLKIGIFWPFYVEPLGQGHSHHHNH